MKLTVGHVYQATEMVTKIINENRPLSQKGAYRFARLYSKLKPEYDTIAARRNAMIEAYGHHEMVTAKNMETGEDVQTEAQAFSVPMNLMPEFIKAWAEVAGEEIDVDVEPIPLDQISAPHSDVAVVSAGELIILDELVRG